MNSVGYNQGDLPDRQAGGPDLNGLKRNGSRQYSLLLDASFSGRLSIILKEAA